MSLFFLLIYAEFQRFFSGKIKNAFFSSWEQEGLYTEEMKERVERSAPSGAIPPLHHGLGFGKHGRTDFGGLFKSLT